MKLFSSSTRFFINGWTWGYEDVYKAIARAFDTKVILCMGLTTCKRLTNSPEQIHIDRYKSSVYSNLEREPFLRSILTRDEHATRFHACERFDRCSEIKVDGRATHTSDGHHVVYVNPVTMSVAEWDSYVRDTEGRLQKAEPVHHLVNTLYTLHNIRKCNRFFSVSLSPYHDTLPYPSCRSSFQCSNRSVWYPIPSIQS